MYFFIYFRKSRLTNVHRGFYWLPFFDCRNKLAMIKTKCTWKSRENEQMTFRKWEKMSTCAWYAVRAGANVNSVVLDCHEVISRGQRSVADLVSLVRFRAIHADLRWPVDGSGQGSGTGFQGVHREFRFLTGHGGLDTLAVHEDLRRIRFLFSDTHPEGRASDTENFQ